MMLSPTGLSAVTQLSVPRVVSLMMGAWFLGTSYSEVLAASLGQLSAMEVHPDAQMDVVDALTKYSELFTLSAWIGIIAGVVILSLTPLLKRWMNGVK